MTTTTSTGYAGRRQLTDTPFHRARERVARSPLLEPIVGVRLRNCASSRGPSQDWVPGLPIRMLPGHVVRPANVLQQSSETGSVSPRRLGHVLYGTPDIEGSTRFLTDVIGFRLSDASPGIIAFLTLLARSPQHRTDELPGAVLHHSSWQVNDVDEIGHGAQHMMSQFPGCSAWGLGRHFLGSNLFWYLRDPLAISPSTTPTSIRSSTTTPGVAPAIGSPTNRCMHGVRPSRESSLATGPGQNSGHDGGRLSRP